MKVGEEVLDPDPSYVLTPDNLAKIAGISLRFRCSIPVILSGETGCGKTALVTFISRLGDGGSLADNTMVILRVHGGTTRDDIRAKVYEAQQIARQQERAQSQRYTIL